MKKLTVLFAFLTFLGFQVLQAQAQEISGTVTSSEDELGVPGASVLVKGTTIGTVTNLDGNYALEVPADANILVYSFIGMKSQEINIDGRATIDVVLEPDYFGLDEVVVSGVASGTPKKKLSVTVGRVDEKDLKEVPASSAAGALQGKLAGVKVVQANGRPGGAASIRLRGATAIRGSQAPLIIIDGVMMEGTLADINVDDIAAMEVVKGAAASALYGSRAGNGVIVISTKRGKDLAQNQTIVTARNEFGEQRITKKYPVATHHPYILADDWASENRYTKYDGVVMYGDLPAHTNPDSIGVLVSGARNLDPDHFMDNPYGVVYDQLADFYKPGTFSTNYVSVASNSERTNFMASFENSKQQGVVFAADGYKRQNFRLNIDHQFTDKFKFSTSNLVIKSTSDQSDMDFFSLLHLLPDMNLHSKNPDGSDYRVKVDQFGTTINPLYALRNTDSYADRNRILSSYNFQYIPVSWLTLEGQYSFEKQYNYNGTYRAKGFITLSSYPNGTDGTLYKNNSQQLAQTAQFTANFNKQFGDFTTKAKLSYLYEDNHWENFNTGSSVFSVTGIPQFNVTDQSQAYNGSAQGDIRAENIFGILDFDYKSKYIGSLLYRYDGASQFGADERWNPYFRVSGAYRVTEDVTIPGISELKVRAAYGTSGNRPPWNAQYETFNISGGAPVKIQLGNSALKPSKIKELEIATNLEFLKRFEAELIYSKTDAEDQFWPVPLPASQGYRWQWQNMGTLTSWSYEATLGASILESQDFSWRANVTWDKTYTEISKLNVAPFTMGARGNSGDPGAFLIEEGARFGEVSGQQFIRSMDVMASQITLLSGEGDTYENMTINDFTLNSDGYVIEKGTEGTILESVIILKDEDGNAKNTVIGDANADFNMTFSNNINYKGFSLYVLIDWKEGGDIYNLTNQWNYRDLVSADQDMFGKPENEKKAFDYYQSIYNVASKSSHFIEDGTYVKVRELSLYYSVNKEFLGNILGGFLKEFRLGFIGRNLYTFTNYSGMDPEIGTTEGNSDATISAWDEFNYPNYRTLSGSIEIKF
ncbi:MAG: SusC/RagA family TonB-linked outer membrane protein [Bacteroidales bacterium]|nr:SusC/RagA family TonB-linked outer membrane protein [Bacteroidales bacterium]